MRAISVRSVYRNPGLTGRSKRLRGNSPTIFYARLTCFSRSGGSRFSTSHQIGTDISSSEWRLFLLNDRQMTNQKTWIESRLSEFHCHLIDGKGWWFLSNKNQIRIYIEILSFFIFILSFFSFLFFFFIVLNNHRLVFPIRYRIHVQNIRTIN